MELKVLKILVVSFYYSPDLSAGSFRTTALVKALLAQLPENAHVEVVTTLPNRYSSYTREAPEIEELPRLTIRRIKLPSHQSGMVDQARVFATYARQVVALARQGNYQLIFGTSSRLMTAALCAYIANMKRLPLYLDIRDIFVDTIKDVLSRKLVLLVKPFFSLVERWSITRANRVNLVSRGFEDYFTGRYPKQHYSFFTNGIDEEFISAGEKILRRDRIRKEPMVVLYAGNIGEGQGLHAVIPELAKRLEGRVQFRLIGDGGRKSLLQRRLAEVGCSNVELLPPVKRDILIYEYQKADILFLHLNDYSAFKKVLPSKLFEYAAMGKPLWAGVAGYAGEFVRTEIDNSVVFHPCDVDDAMQALSELKLIHCNRTDFIEKYAREKIVRTMATDVLSIVPKNIVVNG